MGLNDAPLAERIRIGFFGMRNAGKSSLMNAVAGQEVSVVSDVAGTTTDAVRKTMELLPAGPVVLVDTPGVDDEGDLGRQRVERAQRALRACDVAVLAVDGTCGFRQPDRELLVAFGEAGIPCVVALTKADVVDASHPAGERIAETDAGRAERGAPATDVAGVGTAGLAGSPNVASDSAAADAAAVTACAPVVRVSSVTREGVDELMAVLGRVAASAKSRRVLVSDLVEAGDLVVLVVPIDASAPKGRLILPQQMVMRDLLDAHALPVCCQPAELAGLLARLGEQPRLVITDSQVFGQVASVVPDEVPLTSFSILMARFKGTLAASVAAAERLGQLADGDRVLVAEGCTHRRQCDDIGTVKIPAWVREFAGADVRFEFSSGEGFPDDLSPYKLVIHCGGCMLNEKEMAFRVARARECGVPLLNYGMAIAKVHGILERSLSPLQQAAEVAGCSHQGEPKGRHE